MEVDRWDFGLSMNPERVAKLQAAASLESVVEGIKNDMVVLCCHPDPIANTSIKRVAYCIRVRNELSDLFFNSRTGYRAWYYRSPFEGLRANGLVMQVLAPALLASDQTSTLDPVFIGESLRSPSAKVWLAERGKEVSKKCPGCEGEWSTGTSAALKDPEILNGRWELRDEVEAQWGSKAPYLTKLRVLGAFLDDGHNEFIPANKRFRATEIHTLGWS